MKPTGNGSERPEDAAEKEEALREHELEYAEDLEMLYEAKLQAFENPHIRNSTNRDLKSRLRRAKSFKEVDEISRMIVAEEKNHGPNG
jgi:hypothetical protein